MTNPSTELGGLINSLLAKTRESRLPWCATASALAYSVAFSSSAVTIRSDSSGVLPRYTLSVHNDDGDEIESFTSMMPGDQYYPSLEELFQLARRRATGAEKTIARIQEELARV
jgi:hypothetical protein